jgi:hypothetical protein
VEASQGQQVRSKRIPPARAALDRTHPAAAGCPLSHRTLESVEKFQAVHAFDYATATLCRVKPFCYADLLLLLAEAKGRCFAVHRDQSQFVLPATGRSGLAPHSAQEPS